MCMQNQTTELREQVNQLFKAAHSIQESAYAIAGKLDPELLTRLVSTAAQLENLAFQVSALIRPSAKSFTSASLKIVEPEISTD